MTSKKVIQTRGRKKYLAAAIPLILAAQANAVEFNFGDVEMSLDSQLTLGSSWRMEDRDPALTQGITGSDTFAQNDNDGDFLRYLKALMIFKFLMKILAPLFAVNIGMTLH